MTFIKLYIAEQTLHIFILLSCILHGRQELVVTFTVGQTNFRIDFEESLNDHQCPGLYSYLGVPMGSKTALFLESEVRSLLSRLQNIKNYVLLLENSSLIKRKQVGRVAQSVW